MTDRPEEEPELQSLIESARVGRRDGIEGLYHRFAADVYTLAWGMLDSEPHALQACEKGLMQAFRAREDIPDAAEFPAWLGSLILGECRQVLRSSPSRAVPERPDLSSQERLNRLEPDVRACALLAVAGLASGPPVAVDPEALEAARRLPRRKPTISLWATLDRTLSAQRAMRSTPSGPGAGRARGIGQRMFSRRWVIGIIVVLAVALIVGLAVVGLRGGNGALEVTVIDEESGRPLAGVSVYLQRCVVLGASNPFDLDAAGLGSERRFVGRTDARGFLRVPDLDPGRYVLDTELDWYFNHRDHAGKLIRVRLGKSPRGHAEPFALDPESPIWLEDWDRTVGEWEIAKSLYPVIARGETRQVRAELRPRQVLKLDLPEEERGRAFECQRAIDLLSAAIREYLRNEEAFAPTDRESLIATLERWRYSPLERDGVALRAMLTDPWGTPMTFRLQVGTSGNRAFQLYSFGPNRRDEKGTGDDLSNAETED